MKYNLKIKNVELTAFRGFKEKITVGLNENLTIFIGDNGSGKSGILDAIAYQLMYFRSEMTAGKMFTFPVPLNPKRLKNYDVNNEREELTNAASFALEFPDGDKKNIYPIIRAKKNTVAILEEWDVFKDDIFNSNVNSFNAYAQGIYHDKLEQKLFNIPVLIYYGSGSVNTEIEENKDDIELIQMDIFDTYRQSLEGGEFNFTQFMLLLDRQQKIKLQNPDKRNFIGFLEQALTVMLSDENGYSYQNLRMEWGDLFDEMIMDKVSKDGHISKLVINQLSSGEKNLLALVGDLTRRLYLANLEGNPLDGNGIVLIDEIDVHLHPKWQQKVVTRLREVFPNIQFVVTTHSPLVLSNVYSKHIRAIENEKIYGVSDTFGHDDADDMLRIMGVTSKTRENIKKIHRFLRENKIEEAKAIRATVETEGTFAPLLEIDLFIKRKERVL
jgi:predicted ATP-binding protein involved in virulence